MNPAITLTPGTAVPAQAELSRLRRAARSGMWIETLGVTALLLVAYAIPTLVVDRWLRLEWVFRALLLVSFVIVVARQVQRRLLRPLAVALTDDEMALAVERSAPQLRQALISSLQFDRELQHGAPSIESTALKAAVVADVRARLAAIPFARAIDAARVRRFTAAIAAAVVFFAAWAGIDARSLGLWAARNVALTNVEWPRYTALVLSDAGGADVRLPQGDALTVRVEVQGPVPDQVYVDYAFRGGERGSESMSRTGEREFTWTIESVLADLRLELQGGDSLPLPVTVTIVERPRIDDLAVTVTYPQYMEREPETVAPSEGELRLPKGASLAFAAQSQKPLADAFLLFGSDQKIALTVAPDRRSFRGDFAPTASGVLTVDVIDGDRLGSGTPPKLVLRVGDDKPPAIDFKLRGIGPQITAKARIPGTLTVKDDFGLRSVAASHRVVVDQPPERGAPQPPEVPFEAADATFGSELVRSSRRYETAAQVDLLQWNRNVAEENAPENRVRPGMLLSLRFQATDNFGPGEPHVGAGETMMFRVVPAERLSEDLRRRQVEQREELKRIREEEQRLLLELTEMAAPDQAGDRRAQVEARLRALVRQQRSLGNRTQFVGDGYQRIIWEYENNRLWEPNNARQQEALIPEPLIDLGKDAFPATARQIDAFAGSSAEPTRAAAAEACRDILRRIDGILKAMEQAESIAALIQDLRSVIKLQSDAIRDVQTRVQKKEEDIFKQMDTPDAPSQPKKPEPPKNNDVPK
jgi:hypothetical protein